MNVPDQPDRVLLVDDNPTNLQVLYEALQEEGYELLVAQSGEEALRIAEEAVPSLVLLDINMPGMDGYETCEKLKQNPKTRDAVIVYLSARGDVGDKLKAFDSGGVDYVSKPFSFEEVIARVRTHLEGYHQRRRLEEKLALGFGEMDNAEVGRRLAGGESDKVEFKSTLRTNLHSGKPDKRMENACLKTIAAFLNSEGGLLFIGVDDEGEVLDLEADRFTNEDKFLLHLNTLIANHLGAEVAQYTRTTIREIGGHRCAMVECLRAPSPVFFKRENDEHFYVRSGPATRSLSPRELLAYVASRGES